MPANDVQGYLFSDNAHPLALRMAGWMHDSRRFATFVETYRDKIRKKIRSMPDEQSLFDLQVELRTAYLLLRERRFTVTYEPGRAQGRNPDFAVTFGTGVAFNVEATRLRPVLRAAPEHDPQPTASDGTPDLERLTDTICGKLQQLTPQMINLLVVGVKDVEISGRELSTAMQRLKQRAEQRDSPLFRRHGFRDPADFFRHYGRLNAVIPLAESRAVAMWINPQASIALPPKLRTLVARCFESSP